MNLRYAPNLDCAEVFEGDPWRLHRDIPDACRIDKGARHTWANSKTTDHVFWSGFVGIDPNTRVSTSNPPAYLTAVVGDYDYPQTDEELNKRLSRFKDEDAPTLLERSPTPGHYRSVWVLDKPLRIEPDFEMAAKFHEFLAGKLQLKRMGSGLDKSALTNPGVLYCLGPDSGQCGSVYSRTIIQGWYLEFMQSTAFKSPDKESEIMTPEEAYPLLLEKYPRLAEWIEEFVEGSKGVCFFNEDAQHPGSTFVRPWGVITYSDHAIEKWGRNRFSWQWLLGTQALEKFRVQRIERFTHDIYYDGKTYLAKVNGIWKAFDREAIRGVIQERGACPVKRKEESVSEVMAALNTLHCHKRVAGAAPFMFHKNELVNFDSKDNLNIWRYTGMEASKGEHLGEWGEGFTDIARIIELQVNCPMPMHFPEAPEPNADQLRALKTFIADLVHYRQSKHLGNPTAGHGVLISGEKGMGKTLLVQAVLGPAFGGAGNAAKYLSGGDQFGGHLFTSPIWYVDDASVVTDLASQRLFTQRCKSIVADPRGVYHNKFQVPVNTDLSGMRLFILLNNDPVSLINAPTFDQSSFDKFCIYETAPEKFRIHFPGTRTEIQNRLTPQIPAFLQFLDSIDLDTDEFFAEVIEATRYRVKPYHSKTLLRKIIASGFSAGIVRLIYEFAQRVFTEGDHEGKDSAELTATQVVEGVSSLETSNNILKGVSGSNYTKITRCLVLYAALHPEVVEMVPLDEGNKDPDQKFIVHNQNEQV